MLVQDKWRNLNMEAKEREAGIGDTDDDPEFKVSTAYLHACSPSSVTQAKPAGVSQQLCRLTYAVGVSQAQEWLS